MATHEILVFNGIRPERQPAGDTLALTGPLDVTTQYITATGSLIVMPGVNSAFQTSNVGNARGDQAIDLQMTRDANTQVASGSSSMILGGARNTANGVRAMVVGGEDNITTGQASCVMSGDQQNIDVNSVFSVICGGQSNSLVDATYSFIGSGDGCTINSADGSFIGGGIANDITGIGGVIVGGSNNDVTGSVSVICGGATNLVSGNYAFIGGGRGNTCNGVYSGVLSGNGCVLEAAATASVICGGYLNSASQTYVTCAGGRENSATANHASVVGGRLNVASANYATCLGGYGCEAATQYGSALGRSAKTFHQGEFALASSGVFASAGDSQRMVCTLRRATSNATPRYMYVDGAAEQLTIPANTCWAFSLMVAAMKSDGTDVAGYDIRGVAYRDGDGNVTFAGGTPSTTVIAETNAAWDCVVEADTTNQAVAVKVTGPAATSINWVARAEIIQTQVTG